MQPYGINLSKDVMVAMRDGVRLAFDVYRPACDGAFVDGRFPTIMLHTPYDKTDRRYSEIADFFVPRGYAVVQVVGPQDRPILRSIDDAPAGTRLRVRVADGAITTVSEGVDEAH